MRHLYLVNLIIIFTIAVILTSTSCTSNTKENNVTPANTDDSFSQCKSGIYSCYGDNTVSSVLTVLVPIQSSNQSYYEFNLGMIVDKNPYQQLTVNISLSNFSGKGVYKLTSTNTDVYYIVRPAATTNYQSTKVTGTLEITEYQPKKYLIGTFAIKSTNGKNDLELTEGKFKVEADF